MVDGQRGDAVDAEASAVRRGCAKNLFATLSRWTRAALAGSLGMVQAPSLGAVNGEGFGLYEQRRRHQPRHRGRDLAKTDRTNCRPRR